MWAATSGAAIVLVAGALLAGCGDGENVSPPLAFLDVPPRARELALVVEDPDGR